jgi:hypothetical protein
VTSRLSVNAAAQYLNPTELKSFVKRLDPGAIVIMDGMTLAQDIASMLPTCTVIHRDYSTYHGDDDLVNRITPEHWLDTQYNLGAPHIWRQAGNEMGFTPSLAWYEKLIQYNLTKSNPLRMVIGNFSVGTPEPDAWSKAHQLLELASKHRDIVIWGSHEYFAAVPTSGFYGGYPDNAGVQPGAPGGKNLIHPASWPTNTTNITLWHCGRFRFMLNECQKAGIPAPRIILTEHGADDVRDIQGWLDMLQKTAPYTNIRGWKTLVNQWHSSYPQWSAEQAYFEMLAYLDAAVYQNSPVEAQCLFTWSNKAEWGDFDIAHASTLQNALVAYSVAKSPIPAPPPVVIQPPATTPPGNTASITITIPGLTTEQATTIAKNITIRIN